MLSNDIVKVAFMVDDILQSYKSFLNFLLLLKEYEVITYMNRIYALLGPHGSGKATLVKHLVEMGVHCIPTYTTDDTKRNRLDTHCYRIIERAVFFKEDYVAQTSYKGEYYGIRKQDALNTLTDHQISVCLLERNTLKQMQHVLRNKLLSIFIFTDFSTLIERLLRLGHTKDEMRYHLEYAQNNSEFENAQICDYAFKNNGTVDEGLLQLASIMGLTQLLEGDALKKKL